jgi:hypothetical protein
MDDLERLFRGLVQAIRESNPARLNAPFQISELYQSILPYRTHRSRLRFDSSEDYDMAVLRLLAGERNYASVEPVEVMEQLALEAESINPTPGLYRDFAAASVTLNAEAMGALDDDAAAYAPPEMRGEPRIDTEDRYGPPLPDREDESARPVFEAVESHPEPSRAQVSGDPSPICCSCTRQLPSGRRVLYCPFCGAQVGSAECRNCGDVIERGWRFCVTCGESPSAG